MAITIQDQPTTTIPEPSFAPIQYLASSSNSTESGFKVIASIFVDPSGANTKVSTMQLNTIPNATQVIASIQNIVQSFVSSSYSVLVGNTTDVAQSTLESFKVTFQEYYNGALQGSAVDSNIFSSWNSSPKYIEYANLSDDTKEYWSWSIENKYTASISVGVKTFLNGFGQEDKWFGFTKADNFLKLRATQKYQASWLLRSGVADTTQVWLKTFDSSLNALQTVNLSTSNAAGLYTLDVGAAELASHSWSTAVSMTGVAYYVIAIYSVEDDSFLTKSLLFEIEDCSLDYTDYELHWLNRYGAYDSYTFTGKSNQTTSIKKTFAKYDTKTISGTSIKNNTYAQRKRAFNTALKDDYKLNSRLIRDFEVEGLEDLFSSPEVYWLDGSNFVSVNVVGNTYEHAKSENGKVYSLAVQMEIDNSDTRQW